MQSVRVAIIIAILPASEPTLAYKPLKTQPSSRQLPVGAAVNPCSAYGPGFAKVDGTDTCIKIGGAVSIGVGVTSGRAD